MISSSITFNIIKPFLLMSYWFLSRSVFLTLIYLCDTFIVSFVRTILLERELGTVIDSSYM